MNTNKLKLNAVKVSILLLISAFMMGCSLFGDSATVSGDAVKGPIANGTVTVYVLNENGTRGSEIAAEATASDGSYTVSLGNYTGPVAVVITGGSYTDEATGDTVTLDQELETLLASTEGSTNVAVTALTTIAAANASENAADGLATAIESANTATAGAFGLSGVDISSVTPSDLTQDASSDTESQKAYGAVQSGLSQFAENNELTAAQVLDLVSDMALDFKDGSFDGKDAEGIALEFTLTVTPEEALNGLKTAMENFLASDENNSGISWSDLGITIPAL